MSLFEEWSHEPRETLAGNKELTSLLLLPCWASGFQDELALCLWRPQDGRKGRVLRFLRQEDSGWKMALWKVIGTFMTYTEKNPDVDLADGVGCNQTYLNTSIGTTLVCRSPGASG